MKRIFWAIAGILILTATAGGDALKTTVVPTKNKILPSRTFSSASLIDEGKALLADHKILEARDKFQQVVTTDPGNQEGQFLYGVTRVFAVYEDGQDQNTPELDSVREILESSGIILTEFNLFNTRGTTPETLAATTPRTGEIMLFLKNKLLTEVDGALANMAMVTGPSFASVISPSATITVDYADVQVLRALLYGLKCQLELLQVYGLDVYLPPLLGPDGSQLETYGQLLQNDSTLLAPINPSRLPVAKSALINFIDTYNTATTLIAGRSIADGHLFVADVPLSDAPITTTTEELDNLKANLAEIRAALDGPTYLSFINNSGGCNYIDLSRLFDSSNPINIRNMVDISEAGIAFPDATISGLFPQGLPVLDLTITTTSPLTKATTGIQYSMTLTSTGGFLPCRWSIIEGTLPPGLQLYESSGEINGTPTTAGSYTFIVQARDSLGVLASKSLSIIVSSSGDYDGDGKPDLLWRNSANGQNAVWYMDGTTRTGSDFLPELADLNWQLVGTGDFDSDGKPDILWRNSSTGLNAVWYMDGATRTGSSFLLQLADLNWQMVGAADYNNDSKPDILWRNTANGQNAVWYMDGTTLTGSDFLPELADQSWKMAGQ